MTVKNISNSVLRKNSIMILIRSKIFVNSGLIICPPKHTSKPNIIL